MPKNLLENEINLLNGDVSEDDSVESKENRLINLESKIEEFAEMSVAKAQLMLDAGTQYLDFQRNDDAWEYAYASFNCFIKNKEWELAVVACDIMVSADQKDSLLALAHGVWLGITYPIAPETTVAILQHLIDESPVGSETAAVAAVTAYYIADIRGEGKEGESLKFFTEQIMGKVAAEHRNVSSQQEFEIWRVGNQFDDPDSFLPKLSAAIDSLAADNWWFDREKMRSEIF